MAGTIQPVTQNSESIAMIRRLSVSNFRSLDQNVVLELNRLTALVGPNGAGKSNAVDAVRFVADTMRIGLEGALNRRHGIKAVRRWSSGHPFNVSVAMELTGSVTGRYGFTLTGDRSEEYRVKEEFAEFLTDGQHQSFRIELGVWKDGPSDLRPKVDQLALALPLMAGDERFRPLADALGRMEVYSIFPDTLREPQKYDPAKPMHVHGGNWVSVLKDQPTASWKPDLLAALGHLTGDIQDLRIKPVGGYLLVEFKHARDRGENGGQRAKWFESAQESDGTLRFAGIVTALLQEPPLTLIGIEEPELTVHPGAIPLLYDFLRQASEVSQVILTTHSPELLDRVDTADVRVVERSDGVTRIGPLEEEQRSAVKDRLLSLGDFLRTEGLRQQPLFSES